MQQRMAQTWQQLSEFIIHRNSLDIGALGKLMDMFLMDSNQDIQSFTQQIIAFLAAVTSQGKSKLKGQAEIVAVLAVDALVGNLYSHTKNGEPFQPNSSSFYGWMSSSQMSMDQSGISEREGQLITEMIGALANSQSFFKRLKATMQKGKNQQKCKRYIQGVLQTLDSIMGIEKISRQNFNKLRGKYIGLQRCKKLAMNYNSVNEVLFSSQLNKVVAVLTQGGDNVHLALLRIYLTWNQQGRVYQGCKFTGDQMLVNLYRYYVGSFRDVEDLFEEGKHPIFRLITNHLALYFTPTLRKFHQIVVKIAPRCGNESGFVFYKAGASYLQSELSEFVNELPNQLLKVLSQLKDLVEQQYPNQAQSLAIVKKMFFYSFLLNQSLMEQLYPKHDPSKYSLAYNHILNLFFQSSIKKYPTLSESQQQFINRLIDKLSGALDDRIVHLYVRLETEEGVPFKVMENIVNHDYEVILGVLNGLQFTPKDYKQFDMKKVTSMIPQSPVHRHFKTQGFKPQQLHSELQLATWMSVGGSHDYSSFPKKSFGRGIKQRLNQLHTIDAKTRSRLQTQSQSFLQYFRHDNIK